MAGTNDLRGGAPATVQELFDLTMSMAALSYEANQKFEDIQNQMSALLRAQQTSQSRLEQQIRALAEGLQKMYAPEQVRIAGENAQVVVEKVERRLTDSSETIAESAHDFKRYVWMRWVAPCSVVLLLLIAAMMFYTWKVPSRRDVEATEAHLAALDRQVQMLEGLRHESGQTWVVITEAKKDCDVKGRDCQILGRVQ